MNLLFVGAVARKAMPGENVLTPLRRQKEVVLRIRATEGIRGVGLGLGLILRTGTGRAPAIEVETVEATTVADRPREIEVEAVRRAEMGEEPHLGTDDDPQDDPDPVPENGMHGLTS